jgi:hypothetical protein
MKELNKTAVSILCFIGGGLLVFFAAADFNKTRSAVNQINNTGSSNVGFPPKVDPFAPMVWAGAGWYYGHWYNDEDTYNSDVNVNRNVNRYDDNGGYDREGDRRG